MVKRVKKDEDQEKRIIFRDRTFLDVNKLLIELNLVDLPKEVRPCHFLSFYDCNFIKLDLTYWDFSNCSFERTKFENCYLDGAQFLRSKFTDSRFNGCSLRNGSVPISEWTTPVTSQTRIIEVKMDHVVFSECDLTDAYIKTSQLNRTEFQSCVMYCCDFLNCHLDGISIFRCNLNATRFRNVYFGFFCNISNSEVGEDTLFNLPEDHKVYDAYKIYNQIYKLFKGQGLDDISIEYIFLAKRFERMSAEKWYNKLWLIALQYSCGYGEKPGRVVIASLALIIMFAIIHGLHGLDFSGAENSSRLDYAIKCLYYSVVTFTAFGDGDVHLDRWGMVFTGLEVGFGLLLTAIGTASFYKKITK